MAAPYWRSLVLYLLILFSAVGYSGECTGNFDDYQADMVCYNAVRSLCPDGQGKILTLGLMKSAIAQLRSRFPLLQIVPIDDELFAQSKGEFYTRGIDSCRTFENQYDAIIIFLALEKNPHREARLRLMYEALKPQKKGIIFFTPNKNYSLDGWVEKFLEDSKWRGFLSNVPTLSLSDYQNLIAKAGFSIIEERELFGVLHTRDTDNTSQWICDRWAVPLPMRIFFVGDFYDFLNAGLKGHSNIFLEVRSFLIEK